MNQLSWDPVSFQTALLDWYDVNARSLPWRDQPTPYRVWISEIMLQQTRVYTATPYFERFVHALPTVDALAAVSDERLLKLWEGLGYYHRAKNLKKAAALILRDFSGVIPKEYEALISLPGIGPYSAGAIASIAYGVRLPAIDGNVIRVFSRVDAITDDPSKAAVKKRIEYRVNELLPDTRIGDFNQALMELGATVCLPSTAPLCSTCPILRFCKARRLGIAGELPRKTVSKSRKAETKTVLVITDGFSVALRRRPDAGLLPGLWEFPNAEGNLSPSECMEHFRQWGIIPTEIRELKASKHIFSHLEWHMTGYMIFANHIPHDCDFSLVTADAVLKSYSIPTAYKTYLKAYLDFCKTNLRDIRNL